MNTTISSLETADNRGRALFRLAVIVPFFLAAALHLSAIFKIFAALPLVYAFLKYGRFAGLMASITNMALVWLVSGRTDAAWFFVIAVILGTTLSETVKLRLKTEWSVLVSMGMVLFGTLLLLLSYAHKVHQGPTEIVKAYISHEVDEFAKNAEKYKETSNVSSQDLDRVLIDPELTKRNIFEAAPSIVLISLLLIVVSNILLLFKLNFANVRESLGLSSDYFKRWKSPDHMVWVTLAAGFCLIIEIPVVSELVALNLFRVLMAIYAIQGIAIVTALLDRWGVKGFLRPVGYVLAITFLLPLVISLGFFDLWFCFREKFNIA